MELVQKFAVENLGLLLSGDNRTEAIKLRKKEFFERNRLSASFSLKDVAFETVKYIIRLHNIQTEDELRKVITKSFFLSEFLTEHQIEGFIGLINPLKLSVLTANDLGKLGQEQFLQTKEKEMLDKVTQLVEVETEKKIKNAMDEVNKERQHLEELRKSAEDRLEEVKNVESLLDSFSESQNPESFIEEEKKEGKQFATWWQKIGLAGDPFPNKLGLDFIPTDKYEKVVVFTSIFKDYLGLIDADPSSFYGKTILINGQFGSGKTTFMAYISYKLAQYKIIPYQLLLDAVGDIDSLRQSFYSDLFSQIGRALKQRGLVDPRPMGISVDKTTIADLLAYLSEEAQIDGFSIMIDGLHKAESTLDTALEFVKQLQNFHEFLNNKGLKVSIFIAGSPLWQRKIAQNPAFKGSFYKIDEIPQLTFEDAYSLLQKRFEAFRDPNIPIFFEKSTVRFAFDCVRAEAGFATFRDFIDYILPKLQKGDLKELGISISIDIEDAQKIDKALKSSAIKNNYSLFKDATKDRKGLKQSCANVLRIIYKRTCLVEKEQQFVENKAALYTLRNAYLIRKLKTPRGTGWALSTEFITALDSLNEEGYPPEIVFLTFALDPKITKKNKTANDPLMNKAQDYLAKWESGWPEIVLPIKAFLEKTERVINLGPADLNSEICNDCKNALLDLVECAQLILKNNLNAEEWLRTTWLDIPILPTIIPLLQQESLVDVEAMEYYQRFRQSASVLLEKLEQLLNAQNVVNLISSHNSKEEMKVLFNAINYLEAGELDKAIDLINSNMEKRIRSVFHLMFSLRFGPDYIKYLPETAQIRISQLENRGPLQLKRSVDKNMFYHLTRSEYAEVVNAKANWNIIFEKLFSPKQREEVVEALQLTFALDDRNVHRDRKDYFRERKGLVRQAIVNADWLYESFRNVINLSFKPNGFCSKSLDGTRIFNVSFLNQGDASVAFPWKIDSEKGLDIGKRILRAERTLNVLDDASISSTFNGLFAEVFVVMSLLLKQNLINIEPMSDGNMYIRISPKK